MAELCVSRVILKLLSLFMLKKEQFVCKRCCMDRTAREIVFTDTGCNFCVDAVLSLKEIEKEKHKLPKIIERIKKDGQGEKYDCIIGLSGGVDSSYTLYNAVNLGLRPLCFSVDNGWNEPLADSNIMKMVEGLKVPFYRRTVDLNIFRSLLSAFLKSGTKNIEIPSDHLILATTYELADQYNIKWILSGGNVSEESVMPASWGHNARDLVHIKDIYKKFTRKRLTGLPTCGLVKWNYYKWVRGIKMFYLLDYL